MRRYKPWLHDDHLAANAEMIQHPDRSWRDFIPVLWAGLMILFGTVMSLFQR